MVSKWRRRLRRILGITLVVSLVVLLCGSAIIAHRQVTYAVYPCRTTIRIVQEGNGEAFLRPEEVAQALSIDLTDSISRGIDPHRIEQELATASPYIRRATAYVSPSTQRLHLLISGRTPIVRYWRDGSWWFLDSEGIALSRRPGTAVYVPVAGGHLTDGTVHRLLYPLADYLCTHEEWSHFFGYIEILSETKVHLHPRIGSVVFEIRGIDTLESDLAKIPVYYRKIEPQVGTNAYSLVKLSYENQIVCVRNPKK